MIPGVVFKALNSDSDVSGMVSGRIYRDYGGDSPQAPYLVWSPMTATPENNLSNLPPTDLYTVRVDAFARTEQESDNLIIATRNVMQTLGHVQNIQSLGREPDTKLWRYTLDVEIYRNR